MRWWIVQSLFRKEMLDTLRDRRTLLVMIMLPIVIYPLFGILASQAQLVQSRKLQRTRFVVGVVGGPVSAALREAITRHDDLRYLRGEASHKQRWQRELRAGRLALVLEVFPAAAPKQYPPKVWPQERLVASYASTKDSSRAVWRRVYRGLSRYRRGALRRRLKRRGLSPRFVQPVRVVSRDVVSVSGRGRYAISLMFPMLLIVLTVMGAFYPAIDLTAGEKERGTLETLLTAPISSLEIVAGKYLAVSCIATVAGALNLLSLWFTFSHGIRMAGRLSQIQLSFETWHYAAILGFLVLVAALSSAVMMAIASLARSYKEGQNYVTPAYIGCLLPAILPSLPGSKATLSTAFVPILNVAFVIRETLNGQLTLVYFSIALASMVLSVALSLWLAAKIFAHEQVLFREGEFAFLKRDKSEMPLRPVPTVGEMVMLLGGLFVLSFYVSMPMQQWRPAWGLGFQLWVVVLALPVAFLRWRRIQWRETLRWRPASWRSYLGAAMMALGLVPLASTFVQWISPILFPDWLSFVEQASRTFSIEHFGVGLGMFLFLFVVSPGVCEELLFRGVVLSSFRARLATWPAIVLTALLFGAFHMHLYRMIPTTLIGIMLGWLCVATGSIGPSMVAHALNNGVALSAGLIAESQAKGLLSYAPLDAASLELLQLTWQGLFVSYGATMDAWWLLLAGALFLSLGALLVKTAKPLKSNTARDASEGI